jgi:dUTPase
MKRAKISERREQLRHVASFDHTFLKSVKLKNKKTFFLTKMELSLLPLSEELKNLYKKPSKQKDSDSGFDLYMPETVVVKAGTRSQLIPLGVRCKMERSTKGSFFALVYLLIRMLIDTIPNETAKKVFKELLLEFENIGKKPVGFLLLPRSSIVKTPLRQSNAVGLFDPDFREEAHFPVDNISDKDFTIEKGTRLCQIVGPGLEPIQMKLVTELENTDRGAGFGSSGK